MTMEMQQNAITMFVYIACYLVCLCVVNEKILTNKKQKTIKVTSRALM